VAAITFSIRKLQGNAKVIMAICEALTTIIYISYIFLIYPGIWGENDLAYGYDGAVFIIGIVTHAGSYYYNRTHNINIGLQRAPTGMGLRITGFGNRIPLGLGDSRVVADKTFMSVLELFRDTRS
jgi:hypothetical protein